jgi:dihydrofolate reductase
MSKVTYEVSMSLDGFITAANVRPEAGLGDGGERLHAWAASTDPRNVQIVEGVANTGATITGRVTYDLSIQYWAANGPLGPARLPTVVVSHSVPKNVPQGSVYSFVNGIDEIVVHLVPVVFGSGTPLFGDLNSKHIRLEAVEVIETKEVIHQRFRVVK